MFDVNKIRNDFPILSRKINGKNLVYFDNAATTQKPQSVISRITEYYENENANVHRGVYYLSAEVTRFYEEAREIVKEFLNARSTKEILFTKGTTDSINLVASSLCKSGMLNDGDEIIISEAEHHANIVPWQLCGKKLILKPIPVNENGVLEIEKLPLLITEKTKVVSVGHISNVTGTIYDVEKIISIAKENNLLTLLDGAQAVSHVPVDVTVLDVDFYAFSGHKVFAPTGIGVLYAKENLLEKMLPYQGGGEMIDEVSFGKTTFNELPYKFEAGTPNISGALALAEALNYLKNIGFTEIEDYENQLTQFALSQFEKIDGVSLVGKAEQRVPVFSFVIDSIHHYDLGTMLDVSGIAVRTGHHCAQPLMKRFGITGTTRASLAFYNTIDELEYFFDKLNYSIKILK